MTIQPPSDSLGSSPGKSFARADSVRAVFLSFRHKTSLRHESARHFAIRRFAASR
ncbi:hypothetical protein RB5508 [Rhodopirellula baltica SH 1]|uniref:Uncharacterized protein n=1 Tax=Rhodopirellula baltica (strain DSM 10527 / NCIMB 13988 / SH1) TaxID=243090 RepID=Q7URQ6_RHOBA|nr:hypothetical protein RB5508 [Rhodopirellula baltica SH 1]